VRLARLKAGMRQAARHGRIFHLWWHPHNFSQYRSENLAVLERVLDEFDRLAASEGMQSMSMGDVASWVTDEGPDLSGDPEAHRRGAIDENGRSAPIGPDGDRDGGR
jgi:hypothetical protein